MSTLRTFKFSLALAGAIAAYALSARADAPVKAAAPEPQPVAVIGAIGCNGQYTVWVLLSNGKFSVIDEDSKLTLKDIAAALQGVPANVRHFDQNCPIKT